MAKFFDGVKDPERARCGDLLLLPAGRLNLKPSTFAKMGLSIGDTNRSENDPKVVAKWLSKPGARLFMVCDTIYRMQPSDNDRLLTLDATPARTFEDPLLRSGSLVPFGPGSWSAGQWMDAWDKAHDDALCEALAARMGDGGALRLKPDGFATHVWDGEGWLSGDPDINECSENWFPTLSSDPSDHANADTYDVDTVADWNGDLWYAKQSRVRFRSGFLMNLVARGARMLRPTDEFVRLTTEHCVSMWCAEMASRFERRVKASMHFLEGLKANVRADRLRAGKYIRQARKSAKVGTRMFAAVLDETGVRP